LIITINKGACRYALSACFSLSLLPSVSGFCPYAYDQHINNCNYISINMFRTSLKIVLGSKNPRPPPASFVLSLHLAQSSHCSLRSHCSFRQPPPPRFIRHSRRFGYGASRREPLKKPPSGGRCRPQAAEGGLCAVIFMFWGDACIMGICRHKASACDGR
jgi:hypothetical protein